MRIIFIILLIFSTAAGLSTAQGFDWQFDPRLPFDEPDLFIGPTAEIGYINHSGDINYIRDVYSCCSFEEGSGISYAVGIAAETWFGGSTAFRAALTLTSKSGTFKALEGPYPKPDGTEFLSRYTFESEIFYAALELSAKRRLAGTRMFAEAGLNVAIVASQNSEHRERYLGENDYFPGGSKERIIQTGEIPNLNAVSVAPFVKIGRDLSLFKGSYGNFHILAAPPISSVSNTAEWRRFEIRAGVDAYLLGLKTEL